MSRPRASGTPATAAAHSSRRGRSWGALRAQLVDWLPGQRWFAGDHTEAESATVSARHPLGTTPSGADIELVLLSTDGLPTGSVYQLFVGWRRDLPERLTHAVIGADGAEVCFDALHDSEASALLLTGLIDGVDIGPLTAHPEDTDDLDRADTGLVSTAEQTNTSIIFGTSVILKVFRRVEPGANPEAELLRALHRAQSRHSATLVGEWTIDLDGTTTTAALATRYFANSAEGWAMATASVRDLMAEGDLHAGEVGGDFAAESGRLGEAVALVHRDLARYAPAVRMPPAAARALVDEMTQYAAVLAQRVEPLAPLLDGITATFAAVAAEITDSLPLQHIHGDLHLGQTLRTLDGWVLIDFEGEPARSLKERQHPQSPLKDVAGMLRSFDYAAHQYFIHAESDAQRSYRAAEWVRRNQHAFMAGYSAASDLDLDHDASSRAMLRAFQLSKAVYEAGYEQQHRPGWEKIPVAAIAQLTTTD